MKGLREIEIKDLKTEEVYACDIEAVSKLAKTRMYCSLFIVIMLTIIEICCMVYTTILNNIEDKIFSIVVQMIICYLLYRFACLASSARATYREGKNPKKAQYGIVSIKHTYQTKAPADDYASYYDNYDIYIAFPKDGTILESISVGAYEYYQLEEGSTVLVVAFDNKHAEIIPSKSNK